MNLIKPPPVGSIQKAAAPLLALMEAGIRPTVNPQLDPNLIEPLPVASTTYGVPSNLFHPHQIGSVMLRLFLTTVSLTVLLLASASAGVPAAAKEPGASNIGFVLYTKSHSPGTLNARWMFTHAYRGPGLATGGPKEGFVGHYHVRYFYDDGKFSDEYDLVIEKTGDCYEVTWTTDGEVKAVGVGMEVENGLAVGWRRVAD